MKHTHALPLLLFLSLAGCGTDVTGPSASLFSCMLTAPVGFEAGDVARVSGAGNRGLCLEGEAGAEFLYIPFHGADADRPRLTVQVSGAGIVTAEAGAAIAPVADGPIALRGAPAPAGPVRDPLHALLRRSERGELARRLRPGAAPARALAAVEVPTVGDAVSYNVAISCSEADVRDGRVEYVSDHAIVVADTENPPGLTTLDYQHFALTFDTLVHPVAVAHFGEPSDVDENGRAIIFYTRAVNELAGPSEGVYTAGFFWSGDLFPVEDTPRATGCPAANQAEIFYMLVADPAGLVGTPYDVAFIRRTTVAVIAHEYQHLINAGRRLWVNEATEFEEPWLNEGLSHAAEELVFFAASGLSPRSNLDYDDLASTPGGTSAFNLYMAGNFTNYARYLERPDTASLMGIDVLPTRGAAWSFLRYAADRSGLGDEAFFTAVVNARTAGLENLREAIAADPLRWMQDWTVSVFADDALPVEAAYRQPSWDFRALYAASSIARFPLTVLSLLPESSREVRLQPGGAAFTRFGAAGPEAVLMVETPGGPLPASLRGSFLRIR